MEGAGVAKSKGLISCCSFPDRSAFGVVWSAGPDGQRRMALALKKLLVMGGGSGRLGQPMCLYDTA